MCPKNHTHLETDVENNPCGCVVSTLAVTFLLGGYFDLGRHRVEGSHEICNP